MDKKTAIQDALFQQMLASNNTSIITSTLLAAVLAYVQRELISATVIIVWLSLVVLVAVARATLALVYRRSPLDEDSSFGPRLLRFRLGVLTVGFVWGAAGIVMFPSSDPSHQIFLIFMLAGLTAGGVVSYSADLVSAIGFSISALLPINARLFIAGDSLSVAMGMAGMLYLGFMIVILRYMNRNVRENIVLRLDASAREEIARASEERYRLLLNHAPVGIMHYDTNLIITYCNDLLADTLRNTPERLIGLDIKLLKDQSVLPAMRKALDGKPGYYEGHYTATFSDASVWITMTCAPSRDGTGKIIGGVAIAQNVTTLHESNQQMYSLLNSMAEGAYGIDMDGNCKFVNRAFMRILGYEYADEIIGKNTHGLIHHSYPDGSRYPDSECKLNIAFRRNLEIHVTDEVFWKKDGTAVPVEYWSQPIMEGDVVQGAVVTFIDITERKLAEEKIRNLAFYDTLTLLPNRRLLIDRLGQTIAASTRSGRYAAVMFLDLDNFKSLNDLHGHAVGDLLLIEVAKRLKSCVRHMDTVSRFGGDEFVLVFSELDVDRDKSISQVGKVAEKIRVILAKSYTLIFPQDTGTEKTVRHNCTASIGVVVFVNREATPEDLIRWADNAMYHAKEKGRNSIVFNDSAGLTGLNESEVPGSN